MNRLNFACKRFELDEVIKCGLSLSKADYKIMDFLVKNSEEYFNTSEISSELGFDKSTVQRSIKKLHKKEIVTRNQKNLPRGGYIFSYKIKNKKEIKHMIKEIISNWVKTFEERLDKW